MYKICSYQPRNYNFLKICAFTMVIAACFSQVNGCHTTTLNIKNGTWCAPNDEKYGKSKDPNELPLYTTPPNVDPTVSQPTVPPLSYGCKCGALDPESMEGVKHGKTFGRELNRPWVVHFKINLVTLNPTECGGTLLNKRWIITSAFCICKVVSCKKLLNPQTRPHKYNRTTTPLDYDKLITLVEVSFGTQGHNPASNLKIEEAIIHHMYEQGTRHDTEEIIGQVNVALVRMDGDIFNEEDTGYLTGGTVQPICLPGHFHHVNDVDCEVSANFDSIKCQYDEKEKATVSMKTHITSWGWTSSHLEENRANKTNNFGPRRNLFGKCILQNRCNKEITTNYTIYFRKNNEQASGTWPNPSQAHPVCGNFVLKSYQDALQKQKEIKDEKLVPLADTNFLGYVLIQTKDDGNITCYPHRLNDELWNAQSMADHPFKGGWCRIYNNPDSVGNLPLPENHYPSPDGGWGWCDYTSHEPPRQTNYHTRIKEAVVDSFFHKLCDGENYKFGQKTQPNEDYEFCTGYPTVHTYAQFWKHNSDDDTYTFVEHIYRDVRTDLKNPNGKYLYSVPVITPVSGDICKGDTGSTVWKRKDLEGKPYAFLTGIAGRNEDTCGAKDMQMKPQDQMVYPVHTKIKSILDSWVNPILENSPGYCTP